MAWFDEAIFYHIYPLGLCGAPQKNDYGQVCHRLQSLYPWLDHIEKTGFNALYIGPLFESVGHGYETTDYYKLDSRLGDNEDLRKFVKAAHDKGIKVVFDAVFNHTGRDFFAFKDIRENREHSPYLYWYKDVDLNGNNEYNDGFSYANWGGYDLLAKLDLNNPEVRNYIFDVVRYWVREFDVDGLRLDAADVLDFDFLKQLRSMCDSIKEEFWLMGEVIHGEYYRWVNPEMLHSVTDYTLHKALYSGHNDHNYFEIAHTVNRLMQNGNDMRRLYSFADNHDVERFVHSLRNRADLLPAYVLLFTLPGIPSIYYGSEFGVEGRKERYSDASIRPYLDLNDLLSNENDLYKLICVLCSIHKKEKALSYGEYKELSLTTTSFCFARGEVIVTVNNSDEDASFNVAADRNYVGCLGDQKVAVQDGRIYLEVKGHGGEIWIPDDENRRVYEPIDVHFETEDKLFDDRLPERASPGKSYEEMSIEELQAEILACMERNGPLNDRMIRDVRENVYRDSLLNWVRSFR